MAGAPSLFDASQKAATISSGTIEITPRVIIFPDRIIQMGQVSSVVVDFVYPWRIVALLLGAIGIGMLGGAANTSPYGGGPPASLLLTFAACLFGAALFFFWRKDEFLLISTADGRRVQISAKRTFLESIMDRIRDAMEFEPDRDVKSIVNLNAGSIQIGTLLDNRSSSIVNSPGAISVAGDVAGSDLSSTVKTAGSGQSGAAPANVPTNVTVTRTADGKMMYDLSGVLGGAGAAKGGPKPAPAATKTPTRPAATAGAGVTPVTAASTVTRSSTVTGSAGAISVAGDVTGSTLSTSVEMRAASEIKDLIALVERRDVQHKAEIVGLLRSVQASLSAGPSRKKEAKDGWLAFADYATRYLQHVEGLISFVERISRLLA